MRLSRTRGTMGVRSRALPPALAAGLLLVAVSGVASAHEIAGQFEAPLPLSLLLGGAAATVAATALLLGVAVDEPAEDAVVRPRFAVPPPVAAGLRTTARAAFLLAFGLALAAGLSGRQVGAENFATVFVWAVWLKGVAVLAALVGSPWRVLSPWRTLYDLLSAVEGRPIAVLGDYPRWLGAAPALAGYLLWIGVLENLTVVPRQPAATVLLLVGYTVAMLVGGLLFGPAWFRQADALAVLYRLFGRVSPVYRTRSAAGGYRVGLRAPWRGCTRPANGLALVGFVVATVYTVSFDGFTGTPEYQALLLGLQRTVDAGPAVAVSLYLLGFAGFVAAFLATVRLVERLGAGSASDRGPAAAAFAPTVVPIAVAYEVAHNYPFVLESGGRLPAVLWSFLGPGHGPTFEPLWWLSLSGFWRSQVGLIVAGHVAAVVAAHHVAFRRYGSPSAARRAHLPLVVLMVGYTVLSLWIVSRPVVG